MVVMIFPAEGWVWNMMGVGETLCFQAMLWSMVSESDAYKFHHLSQCLIQFPSRLGYTGAATPVNFDGVEVDHGV